MSGALWIGIGGALGAVLRYVLSRMNKKAFPYGTFFVNITGAYLLGLLFSMHQELLIAEWVWLFVGVGFLGAFTTFSTFSFEVIELIIGKQVKRALLYLTFTTFLGIVFAYLGYLTL